MVFSSTGRPNYYTLTYTLVCIFNTVFVFEGLLIPKIRNMERGCLFSRNPISPKTLEFERPFRPRDYCLQVTGNGNQFVFSGFLG